MALAYWATTEPISGRGSAGGAAGRGTATGGLTRGAGTAAGALSAGAGGAGVGDAVDTESGCACKVGSGFCDATLRSGFERSACARAVADRGARGVGCACRADGGEESAAAGAISARLGSNTLGGPTGGEVRRIQSSAPTASNPTAASDTVSGQRRDRVVGRMAGTATAVVGAVPPLGVAMASSRCKIGRAHV